MVKALNKIIVAGLFLTPFLALIVADPLYFPFITGKNFAFRILIELLLGLALVAWWWGSRARPKKSPILWAVIVWLSVVTLATIFSVDPNRSLWSNYERMEGLLTYLHLGAYFLLLISFLPTKNLWRRFLATNLGGSLLVFFYCLLQLFHAIPIHQGGVRLDGPLGNATYLAVYALFHIGIASYLWVTESPSASAKSWKIFYVVAGLANLFMLYKTATRGTILGLILGLLLLALFMIIRPATKKSRTWAFGFVAAVIVLTGAFLALRNSSLVKNSPTLDRLASISTTDTTTQSRLIIWGMSWQGFKERPILGWGPENYNIVFNKYYDPRLWPQEQWFDRSHNVFFDWLIDAGALGLLIYLSLFATALYCLWRKAKDTSWLAKSVLTALLAAYFFHNIFVFDNLISYLLFFGILALIHHLATDSNLPPPTSHLPPPTSQSWIVAGVIIILTMTAIYWLNIKALAANAGLISAINVSTPEASLTDFQALLANQGLGAGEVREQLITVAGQVASSQNASNEIKQQFVALAASEMQKQIAAHPLDARYPNFLGTFLASVGQFGPALDYLAQAQKLSPNKQAIFFAEANVYLVQKKYTQALVIFKQAYDLDPTFPLASSLYALDALYAGDVKLADSLIANGTEPSVNNYLINAYAGLHRYDQVLKLWQYQVAEDPKNAQYRLSLAAAYLATGDKTKALENLAIAAELDPKLAQQVDYLTKEIKAGHNPITQ